jgi:hypothetical protein
VIFRLSGGALGGKGEGLELIDRILWQPIPGDEGKPSYFGAALRDAVPSLPIDAPRTGIVGVDVFDEFVRRGKLRAAVDAAYAEGGGGYAAVREAFLSVSLPEDIVGALADFMPEAGKPLIARSSSLLEDSEGEPFSGIYESYAIPNNNPHPAARIAQLLDAVRLVYASLFSPDAVAYRSASHLGSEESMAVIVQELVGSLRGRWYYPAISGTAESLNFYPLSYARVEDGLGVAALGLGSYVVEGGAAQRFCPAYPTLNAAPPELAGQEAQRSFRVLDIERTNPDLRLGESAALEELDIAEAEGSDALALAASTWDRNDRRLVPGTARSGPRVLDFAPLLKYNALPFAPAIAAALTAGEKATGGPVELEYALDRPFPGGPETLYLLQLKKLRRGGDSGVDLEDLGLATEEGEGCLIVSDRAMGEGRVGDIRDIVVVDPRRFDRNRSREAAEEVAALDRELGALGRQYVLIGPGRWGSRDPWLGVPVSYPQIVHARAIVETEMPGLAVDFSFGSHFLRNVAGRGIGYMAVPSSDERSKVDWVALDGLALKRGTVFCSWLQLDRELELLMDGRRGRALVRLA